MRGGRRSQIVAADVIVLAERAIRPVLLEGKFCRRIRTRAGVGKTGGQTGGGKHRPVTAVDLGGCRRIPRRPPTAMKMGLNDEALHEHRQQAGGEQQRARKHGGARCVRAAAIPSRDGPAHGSAQDEHPTLTRGVRFVAATRGRSPFALQSQGVGCADSYMSA